MSLINDIDDKFDFCYSEIAIQQISPLRVFNSSKINIYSTDDCRSNHFKLGKSAV